MFDKRALTFLGLAFAISWAIVFGAHFAGVRDPAGSILTLAAMMTGPAIAAVICAYRFEPKGQRRAALGLHWTPNWYWLAAWAAPVAIAALSIALTIVLSGRQYVSIGETAHAIATAQGQDVAHMPHFVFNDVYIYSMALFVGAAVNSVILTFTEEFGWRGYLHHLWRGAGFWNCTLRTGAVWGVWHAPAILLFGLNYPENPEIGVVLFIAYCIMLSALLTFLRDRGRSVIAAGIAHGAFNATSGITIGAITHPTFPWNGIVGIGGFLAIGAAVALVYWLKRRESAAPA